MNYEEFLKLMTEHTVSRKAPDTSAAAVAWRQESGFTRCYCLANDVQS